jgi:hypothetical protein
MTVAQNLKLLADFVLDVPVIGMKGFQLTRKGIDIRISEFLFSEPLDDGQDVLRPAGFKAG